MSRKVYYSLDRYKDEWYRKLTPRFKVAWDYIYADCDCAGIWVVDLDVMNLRLGEKFKVEDFFTQFGQNFVEIEPGKCLLVSFFREQYRETKETYNAKIKAIKTLSSYGIEITDGDITLPQALPYPKGSLNIGSINSNINSNSNSNSNKGKSEVTSIEEKCNDIAAMWNDYAEDYGLARIKIPISRDRIEKIKPALLEFPLADDWSKIICAVGYDEFRLGKNDREWKADFDWLFHKTKFNYRKMWELYESTNREDDGTEQARVKPSEGGDAFPF